MTGTEFTSDFNPNLGEWGGGILPPCWFSLNNSEMVKTAILAFSKTLLQTFVPSLVSLPHPSLQTLGKTQTWFFPISGFLVNPLRIKIVITPEPETILTRNLD